MSGRKFSLDEVVRILKVAEATRMFDGRLVDKEETVEETTTFDITLSEPGDEQKGEPVIKITPSELKKWFKQFAEDLLANIDVDELVNTQIGQGDYEADFNLDIDRISLDNISTGIEVTTADVPSFDELVDDIIFSLIND